MIFLKIKDKGHFVEIPGLPPFRTPVKANITHLAISMVVTTLKAQGIKRFEIVSDIPGKEQKLTQDDFVEKKKEKPKDKDKEIDKKLNRMEELLMSLVGKRDNSPLNKEQITKRLDSIEHLIRTRSIKDSSDKGEESDEPLIEELEAFIPEVDLRGMRISGSSIEEKTRDDDDTDEAADLLSSIRKK